MGTVYRDQRGNLYLNYTDLHGRRMRVPAKTGKMKGAQERLRSIETEIHEARVLKLPSVERLKAAGLTFSVFAEGTFFPSKAPPTRRERSHRRDLDAFAHVKPVLGDKVLSAIGPGEIEDYLTGRKKEKTFRGGSPAPRTLNLERRFIGSVLGMARRRQYIKENPIEAVEKAKVDQGGDRALSPEQLEEILKRLPDYYRGHVLLAAETGMRLSEVTGLKWSQVDRKDGEPALNGWIRLAAEETKGRRDRKVPITPAVKAILARKTPVMGEEGFLPWVFVNEERLKPFRGSSVSHAFKRAAVAAGISPRFHDLRHTAVSRLTTRGVPDRIIMAIIGHSTPALVSIYSHVKDSDILREIKRVGVSGASAEGVALGGANA